MYAKFLNKLSSVTRRAIYCLNPREVVNNSEFALIIMTIFSQVFLNKSNRTLFLIIIYLSDKVRYFIVKWRSHIIFILLPKLKIKMTFGTVPTLKTYWHIERILLSWNYLNFRLQFERRFIQSQYIKRKPYRNYANSISIEENSSLRSTRIITYFSLFIYINI